MAKNIQSTKYKHQFDFLLTRERGCDIISVSGSRGIGGLTMNRVFGGVFLLPIMAAGVFSDGLLPVGQPSLRFLNGLEKDRESV